MQGVEDALLNVDYRLRIGIIVDEADEKIAPERQRSRLRIGDITELLDDLLDSAAGFIVQQRRIVDRLG